MSWSSSGLAVFWRRCTLLVQASPLASPSALLPCATTSCWLAGRGPTTTWMLTPYRYFIKRGKGSLVVRFERSKVSHARYAGVTLILRRADCPIVACPAPSGNAGWAQARLLSCLLTPAACCTPQHTSHALQPGQHDERMTCCSKL